MKRTDRQSSRRKFLKTAASSSFALTVVPRHVLGGPEHTPPSETVNVACVGSGGKGGSDIRGAAGAGGRIVALCDVDEGRAKKSREKFPEARFYQDYRVMLEKEKENIDAVTVSTPDHNHAPAASMAIQLGKGVYVQKPLTHSIKESQRLTELAREYKVATQMGNQGHSSGDTRKICEWIWQGAIGTVKEVHYWTNRPIWPQGIDRPTDTPPVPEGLNWDCWLGPAPERPYNSAYHPFRWRGWWDFGCGALGDMACHIMDASVWALNLSGPVAVEADSPAFNDETYPKESTIIFEFPARTEGADVGSLRSAWSGRYETPQGPRPASFPPVKCVWFDGGRYPERPEALDEWIAEDPEKNEKKKFPTGNNGQLYIGDKGVLIAGTYGGGPQLWPKACREEFFATKPEELLPRSIGHYREWIEACKGGAPSPGGFQHAGPLTGMVLLGNVAMRAKEKIEWNGEKVANVDAANEFLGRECRNGWTV